MNRNEPGARLSPILSGGPNDTGGTSHAQPIGFSYRQNPTQEIPELLLLLHLLLLLSLSLSLSLRAAEWMNRGTRSLLLLLSRY
ncbi:hypothetical protein XELAEV_18002781mg [Xenopus laevis]|uniref:Uncharacterized protein n=1 Tax=Xenopus laevis TaxID=8355 RepID=A0A974BNQ2_XENLA|nr:hypothetical protein XELAEV_18002781mg [Xenopus laevis]